MKLSYGFLDESPTLNSKEFFFCVDIISSSERTIKSLKRIVKKARTRVVKKKRKQLSEFKFRLSNEKTRTFVLKQVAKLNVGIVAVIIDKDGRKVKDTPQNYGLVVGATVAECLKIRPNLNLTPDKKYTNPKQQQEFLQTTSKAINKLAPKNTKVFFNPPVDSQKENPVQLADFVAGAFNAKYNQKKEHYVEIIKKRVEKEKVLKWTLLKKRIVSP